MHMATANKMKGAASTMQNVLKFQQQQSAVVPKPLSPAPPASPEPTQQEAAKQVAIEKWLEHMSLELCFARTELEMYQALKSPLVLYHWEDLLQATQGFSSEKVIGYSDYGTTYRALLGGVDVSVFLFSPPPGESCRLPLVMQQLSYMSHPNLVPILGFGARQDQVAVVSKWMRSGSLATALNSPKGVTWQQRLAVAKSIGEAVLFCHSHAPELGPLPHGDLNSNAVMLHLAAGSVRLAEFYTALVYGNAFPGLVQQLAPRSWRDHKSIKAHGVSLQCDVYSYGALVLELLLGRLPARDLHQLAVRLSDSRMLMKAVDEAAGEWPEQVAEDLRQVAAACLQGAQEARPSMMTVYVQVQKICKGVKGLESALGGDVQEQFTPTEARAPIFPVFQKTHGK